MIDIVANLGLSHLDPSCCYCLETLILQALENHPNFTEGYGRPPTPLLTGFLPVVHPYSSLELLTDDKVQADRFGYWNSQPCQQLEGLLLHQMFFWAGLYYS